MIPDAVFPLADTWGMHGDAGSGWWIVMMAGMVLFWGAIVGLVVWLIVRFGRSEGARTETALDTLERRFAEGTLSAEEYRERREVLAAAHVRMPAHDR